MAPEWTCFVEMSACFEKILKKNESWWDLGGLQRKHNTKSQNQLKGIYQMPLPGPTTMIDTMHLRPLFCVVGNCEMGTLFEILWSLF